MNEETPEAPPAEKTEAPQEAVPEQKKVHIGHFAELDLRVALIEAAESVPKSKKLIKLQVYLGEKYGRRQVLAGIAQWKTPESLVGKKVILIANLEPAMLMGLESQGMLLAVENIEGSLVEPILIPEAFEPGSKVR